MNTSEQTALYGKEFVEWFERSELLRPLRLLYLMKHFHLRKDYVVADFGCGTGRLLLYIKDKVKYYYGVDFSQPCIEAAEVRREKLGAANAEFSCDSIQIFCSRHHAEFDVGFALDLAEHIYDDEWLAVLTAIRSSLKPDGRLYIHTPNADFFLEKMKKNNFIVR